MRRCSFNALSPTSPPRSIEESTEFYSVVLGLEPTMNLGWVATLADPANALSQLTLITEDATAPERPEVSIEVADVDACFRAAVEAGAEIVHLLTDEPWGVRRFFMRDPSGHVINILSHSL